MPTKKFADVQLSSGKTLLEEIIRLRTLAMEQRIKVIVLGTDLENNFFVGGYVPAKKAEVIKTLFDFISWLSTNNTQDESSTAAPDTSVLN